MGKLHLHFLGAAGTVTGSKFLLETPEKNILVDCGLFQGIKKIRQLNWEYLPVSVGKIDAVVLTHGHLDHCGYLPRLVKMGFRGPIIGTAPTLDITDIILEDSAEIQMEEAERANREGWSHHKEAKPLYDLTDVERTLPLFQIEPLDEWVTLSENLRFRYRYNAHILGATFVELDAFGKRIVFSGDVGRTEDALTFPPQKPGKADILLLESTYGDRLHPEEDLEEVLSEIVNTTVDRGGTVIIPSFAVERTQSLMFLLWEMREKGMIPDIPIYMDSPMGADVTDLFVRYPEWHRLDQETCFKLFKGINMIRSYKETLVIAETKTPKIVIAGSGMVTGGRVLTYLQHHLDDPATTVLLVGFQAEGTRGRQLLEGCPEVKIYGHYYPVKAEIRLIQSLSAHADQKELIEWLADLESAPEQVFLVHGEAQAADMLRVKLQDTYGWKCQIPELYEIAEIEV